MVRNVTKKKVIKKVKWKVLGKIGLSFFVIFSIFFYLFQLKVKHIVIKGNEFTSDNEIILLAGLKDYPYLFRESSSKMKNKLLENEAINSVKITKSLDGVITITIDESRPVLYNRNTNRLVLDNLKGIKSNQLTGVPILINYVPDSFYEKLVSELSKIDKNVLQLISEIEYSPWKSNDIIIDDTRFFLRMNDGNTVYVNLYHMDKLNNYIEIFASLEGK